MGAASTKESKHYAAFEASLPSLQGKTVAITGCTSGTGLVAAVCAARKGADHILLLNRPSERAAAAEATVKSEVSKDKTATTIVETIPCDLQDFASVRAAATQIQSKCTKLDVLCNNAGVMALDDVATKDGYDIQMQTNHLSHFLLTKELYPLLVKSGNDARIVQHSSMARSGGPLKAEYFGENGGNLGGNSNSVIFNGAKWERYHQTKLANACFTAALAAKLSNDGPVKAVCAAPGLAQTNLQVTTSKESDGMNGMMWIMHMSQSAEDGTIPLLKACFDPDTANGDFFEPKGGLRGLPAKVAFDKNAADVKQQQMLWETSEEACGKFNL